MSNFMGLCLVLVLFCIIVVAWCNVDSDRPVRSIAIALLGAVVYFGAVDFMATETNLFACEIEESEPVITVASEGEPVSVNSVVDDAEPVDIVDDKSKTILNNLLKDNKTKEEICGIMSITGDEYDNLQAQ